MKAHLEKIQKRPTLKDEAHRRIKALILSGELDSGDMLDIEWLVTELGISRTPLREAILVLEQEGLVETIPYKGTFIAGVSVQDVEEIYQVREAMEALAVRLATPVIPEEELEEMQALFACVDEGIRKGDLEPYFESDARFHDFIVRHSRNEVLRHTLAALTDRIFRVRVFSLTRQGHHLEQSFQEHCRILDAIHERDISKAEALMAKHIRNAGKRIADLVRDEA